MFLIRFHPVIPFITIACTHWLWRGLHTDFGQWHEQCGTIQYNLKFTNSSDFRLKICDLHLFEKTWLAHLHGNVPGHVDMAFKLIHPNLCHSESISPHVRRQIIRVWFVSALYVGDTSAREDLNTAATLPHLGFFTKKRENSIIYSHSRAI